MIVKVKDLVAAVEAAAHYDTRPTIHLGGRSLFVLARGRPAITEVIGRRTHAADNEENFAYVCAQCILYALGTYGDSTEVEVTIPDSVSGHVYLRLRGELYRVPRGEDDHCGRWVESAPQ